MKKNLVLLFMAISSWQTITWAQIPPKDKTNNPKLVNTSPTNTEVIYLENPSFEDVPRAGLPPSGWGDCGQAGETPPDVQPYGGFSVTKSAAEGSTYLGLVTRDNNSWESVAQRLSKPMRKGVCYNFSLSLARSTSYQSATKRDQMTVVNFDKAISVRIWGGNNACEKGELLAQSETIESTDWKTVNFKLTPSKNEYRFIIIEAFYKTGTLFYYNGNVLVDNASPIASCDIPIDEPNPLAINEVKKDTSKTDPIKPKDTSKTIITETPKDPEKVVNNNPNPINNPAKEEEFKSNIKVEDLKIGQTFRLQNLYFEPDSVKITKNAERVLNELYTFLKTNSNVAIEVGGHTNGLPANDYCDRLSNERAKNVAEFLYKKGLPRNQIAFKGYGKRKPIATDETAYGRSRNQRVEIKILDIK